MSTALLHQPKYLPPADRCTADSLIQMVEIVKKFKNAAGEFTALNAVTACFYPGEFVSVVGKSGSGKSTLVNMITGIDHPTSGTVRVADTYVHNLSENDMSIWRGQNLGIVFQFFQLLPTLTLLENVMLPMYLAGRYAPAQREQRAQDLLSLVGLAGMEDKLPAAVSGGQQQSAAIARALANDPPILIADEPTGNLDSHTADEVFALFAGLIDQGKTILMVTHDISLARRTTRTLLISDGEIINPWVAGALSQLGHTEMLWLTHHLRMQIFTPGVEVRRQNPTGHWLMLPVSGRFDVLNGSDQQPHYSVGEGEFLCYSGLQAGEWVRVQPDEPAEALIVEGAELDRWMNEYPAARQGLQCAVRNQHIAQQAGAGGLL